MEKENSSICSADPKKAGERSATGLIFNNRWPIGWEASSDLAWESQPPPDKKSLLEIDGSSTALLEGFAANGTEPWRLKIKTCHV